MFAWMLKIPGVNAAISFLVRIGVLPRLNENPEDDT